MKKNLCVLLASILSLHAFSQSWTRIDDAQKHAGETLNLVGLVRSVEFLKDKKESKILMKIAGQYAGQDVTVIFPASILAVSTDNNLRFVDEYVHLKGLIEVINGKPQMNIKNASQIEIVKQAPENLAFEPK